MGWLRHAGDVCRLKLVVVPQDKISTVGGAIGVEVALGPFSGGGEFVGVPAEEVDTVHRAVQIRIPHQIRAARDQVLSAGLGQPDVAIRDGHLRSGRNRDRSRLPGFSARRRDPVRRLHLAGDESDPQRADDDAVPVGKDGSRCESPCRNGIG